MRISRKLVLSGLLIISAVSCSADATSESTASSTASSSTPTTTVLTATLVGGGDVDIQVALQQSPVALWFWAPG